MKRRLIFGDIHASLEEFKELLEKVKYNKEQDTVYLVGDLVDRNKYSVETVRFVKEMGFKSVMGNHEDKHIRYYKHRKKKEADPKYKIPMRFPQHKLEIQEKLTDEDVSFMETFPYYIFLEDINYLIVHAGVVAKHLPLESHPKDALLHVRYLKKDTLDEANLGKNMYEQPPDTIYWTEAYDGPYNIIYGHNVHNTEWPEIKTTPSGFKTIGIETGCVFGGKLTCAIFEEGSMEPRFEQLQAKEVYWHWGRYSEQ